MAVQVQLGIGITDIPVGFHIWIRHLQLLVKILKVNTLCMEFLQNFLRLLRGRWGRKSLGKITNDR
jgi:hypothetical protein